MNARQPELEKDKKKYAKTSSGEEQMNFTPRRA